MYFIKLFLTQLNIEYDVLLELHSKCNVTPKQLFTFFKSITHNLMDVNVNVCMT